MNKTLCIIIVLIFCSLNLYAQDELVSKTVQTEDGVEIYYETLGQGIPIIMLAGGPGGNPEFFKQTHKLWRAYGQLVFLHNRGRGASQVLDTIAKAYSVQTDILDIEAVRKDLKADKVIIYGHSYGGLPALLYSAEYPDKCLAVITTGTLSGETAWQIYNIDGIKYFLERHYPENWEQISELHEQGKLTSSDAYDKIWPKLTEMYYYNPDNHEQMSTIWSKCNKRGVIAFNAKVYHTIVGKDPEWKIDGTIKGLEITDYLNRTTCPVLIMGGRYDRVCPPAVQKEIADAIHNAELVIFDKSGHRPFIEEPLLFYEISGEFLRKIIGTQM